MLEKALVDTRTVGIGKLTMHQRDYTVFLRPYQGGLLLHTMYFSNEIRQLPQYGVLEPQAFKPAEVKLTEQLIGEMTEPFKPKQYHNEFQERLKKLIEAKSAGKVVEIEDGGGRKAPVIDMMTALKRSLAGKSGAKASGASASSAKKIPAGKSRKQLSAKRAS